MLSVKSLTATEWTSPEVGILVMLRLIFRRKMMNQIRLAALFILALAVGFHAHTLTAVDTRSSAAERARQDFELMKLFAEAYEQIDSQYVRDVDRRELVEAAIRGMTGYLDPHSAFIPPKDVARFEQYLEQEFVGIGIHVQATPRGMEIVSLLPGSPADRAELRSGDVITEVDGNSIAGLSPADVGKLLSGPAGRPVAVSVRRSGSDNVEVLTAVRELIQLPTVVGLTREPGGEWKHFVDESLRVGYVRITHFSRNTAGELTAILKKLMDLEMRSLIVDLRSNPGGLMESAVEIADLFLDSGAIVSMKGRSVKEKIWTAKRGNAVADIPMVVLVNRMSASASEVLSACLQDNKRATIVGERSFGKGSVQSVVPLESGRSSLKLTTASYYRPSGVNIHRFPDSTANDDWGVHPDSGHDIALTKEQWLEWTRSREAADSLRGARTSDENPQLEDIQLQHAVAVLTSGSAGTPAAIAGQTAASDGK